MSAPEDADSSRAAKDFFALAIVALTVFPLIAVVVGGATFFLMLNFLEFLVRGIAADETAALLPGGTAFLVAVATAVAAGRPVYRAFRQLPADSGIASGALGAALTCLAFAVNGVASLVGFSFLLVAATGHGRPLRRRGRVVVAQNRNDDDAWIGDTTFGHVAGDLDAATRSALAEAWLVDARLEHASIAAFAELANDLVALGAPPALVAGAHRAALDEVAHAQVAYALASAYADRPVGPAPFPEAAIARGSSAHITLLTRVAVESLVDGVIGEETAARSLAEAAARCSDERIASVLHRTAGDEATHAQFAWDVLAWAHACGGDSVGAAVRAALDAEFAAARAAHEPVIERDLAQFGRTSVRRLRELRLEVVNETRQRLECAFPPARRAA